MEAYYTSLRNKICGTLDGDKCYKVKIKQGGWLGIIARV